MQKKFVDILICNRENFPFLPYIIARTSSGLYVDIDSALCFEGQEKPNSQLKDWQALLKIFRLHYEIFNIQTDDCPLLHLPSKETVLVNWFDAYLLARKWGKKHLWQTKYEEAVKDKFKNEGKEVPRMILGVDYGLYHIAAAAYNFNFNLSDDKSISVWDIDKLKLAREESIPVPCVIDTFFYKTYKAYRDIKNNFAQLASTVRGDL